MEGIYLFLADGFEDMEAIATPTSSSAEEWMSRPYPSTKTRS